MNRDMAFAFLKRNQPLPPDRELDAKTIEEYDKVRRFFRENPDPQCVSLFLGSFGEGDGLGTYPLISDVLRRHSKTDVVNGLTESLKSELSSVRYWSAQIAAEFPSLRLMPPLLDLLRDVDFDVKYSALTAIEQSASAEDLPALISYVAIERNDELRELANDVVESVNRKHI
jgi:hypothetical protein